MKTWVTDIENFNNLFFVGIKDFKNQTIINYEVSERRDDREALYEALATFDGYLVTFNGLHYDEVVLKYFLKEYDKLKKLPVEKFLKEIKNISNHTIDSDKYPTSFDKIKWYKWHKGTNWISIDLLCYWSKMLRLSKKISLKSLAVQLSHDEIQELPYPHDKLLTVDEIEEVVRYNNRNDLGVTEKLLVKMKGEVLLRAYVKETYGLECWSMDAPKITSEYLLDDYCKKTYDEEFINEEGKTETFEQYKSRIRKTRYVPDPFKIGDYLPPVQFKTKIFQDLYERYKDNGGDFKEKIPYIAHATRIMLIPSVGGIHSENDDQYWVSDDEWVILDADIAGLYPTLLTKYKFLPPKWRIVLDKLVEMIEDRTVAKRAGDKKKDKFLKLGNNGITGIADSSVFWLYSPEYLVALRVFGQLIQLRFIEDLTSQLQDGINVFFTNTDGTCVLIKRSLLQQYYRIAKDIEKEFRVEWEYTFNEKMVFSNTNSYISIINEKFMLDDNLNMINHKKVREVKRKGLFRYHDDIPLGDSVNEQVIPIALEKYFVEGIPVEEVIKKPWEHGIHIYDYCVSKKVSRDFDVIYNNEKQQQLNRYYFSKSGYYLFKRGNDKSKPKSYGKDQHMHKGVGVKIFNKFEELPWEEYKIDYSYYIAKANTLIKELEKDIRQLTLF